MNDLSIYHICVRGWLDARWANWLDGMTMTHDAHTDITCFTGAVRDQAHLHGLLAQVRDAGMQLVSVTCQDEPA